MPTSMMGAMCKGTSYRAGLNYVEECLRYGAALGLPAEGLMKWGQLAAGEGSSRCPPACLLLAPGRAWTLHKQLCACVRTDPGCCTTSVTRACTGRPQPGEPQHGTLHCSTAGRVPRAMYGRRSADGGACPAPAHNSPCSGSVLPGKVQIHARVGTAAGHWSVVAVFMAEDGEEHTAPNRPCAFGCQTPRHRSTW